MTAEISGAVVAAGAVVVDSNVKKVQHPTGGVVGEILIRDGMHVRQGDIIVRLDATVARANLAMVTKNLDELDARQARLEAERDGATELTFSPSSPVPPIPKCSACATPNSDCSSSGGRRVLAKGISSGSASYSSGNRLKVLSCKARPKALRLFSSSKSLGVCRIFGEKI